jgi:signal peptidase
MWRGKGSPHTSITWKLNETLMELPPSRVNGGFVMKKVVKFFGFSLVILLIAAAVFTYMAPYFGWRVDAVMSGSMEPELKVGGLVITRPVESKDIKVGNIITFYCPLNKEMTSHRVLSIENGTLSYFRTIGDANKKPDAFIVPVQNVVGKVCFHIPYLGYVTQFIKTRLGILLILGIPGLIIIAIEIKNIWRALRDEQVERKYRIR